MSLAGVVGTQLMDFVQKKSQMTHQTSLFTQVFTEPFGESLGLGQVLLSQLFQIKPAYVELTLEYTLLVSAA